MNVAKRVKEPTPPFFDKLKKIGLYVLAGAGTILMAPVALPVIVTQVAGYLAVAGAVLSGTSLMTVKDQEK